MHCPHCSNRDTKVTDTRIASDGSSVKRRRKCLQCGYKFLTIETCYKNELVVIKRDGSEEEFDQQKISVGLKKAIKYDEFFEKKINLLMKNIVDIIRATNGKKISSNNIGQIVMNELKKVDPIAYLRFASVYKDFQETHEFEEEFKSLDQNKKIDPRP